MFNVILSIPYQNKLKCHLMVSKIIILFCFKTIVVSGETPLNRAKKHKILADDPEGGSQTFPGSKLKK